MFAQGWWGGQGGGDGAFRMLKSPLKKKEKPPNEKKRHNQVLLRITWVGHRVRRKAKPQNTGSRVLLFCDPRCPLLPGPQSHLSHTTSQAMRSSPNSHLQALTPLCPPP